VPTHEDFFDPLFAEDDGFNYTEDPFRISPDENLYPPFPIVSTENASQQTSGKFDQKASHSNVSLSSNMYYVPDDYPTIQEAVDAANPGDTIIVKSGTYYENVNVNKQLTLRGVDTEGGKPVVDAGSSGSAITLSADGITLEGFTAANSGSGFFDAGIKVTSNNNIIAENTASNNSYGICLESSSKNAVRDNVANNNQIGILLAFSSNNNSITTNIANNNNYGIYISDSSSNTIQNNTASYNGPGGYEKFGGIHLYSASNNFILNNTASSNNHGIILMKSSNNNIITGNTVSNNSCGIYLWRYNNKNTIRGNNASNNNIHGIILVSSNNNTLTNNTANSNKGDGILLSSSSNNIITGNNVSNNSYGISIGGSSNTITNNTANNNSYGIYLGSSNKNTLRGNLMFDNGYNFKAKNCSFNDIDTSNLVNGKPIYYLVGASNTIIDSSSNAGTVYCIDCDNITVKDLILTNNGYGIYFYNTSNSRIMNNQISNNDYGIYFNSIIYNNIIQVIISIKIEWA